MADLGEGPGGRCPLNLAEKRRNDRRKKSRQGRQNNPAHVPPELNFWIRCWNRFEMHENENAVLFIYGAVLFFLVSVIK